MFAADKRPSGHNQKPKPKMDNPIAAVKSGFSFNKIVGVVVGVFVAALIADALGLTKWLLTPYSAAKEQWSKNKAA